MIQLFLKPEQRTERTSVRRKKSLIAVQKPVSIKKFNCYKKRELR